MKQITCFLLVFFFMISSTVLFSQQPTSLDKLKMEQMEKYVNSDNGPSVKATAQPVEGEHYTSYATYYPSRSELYNNGPFITHPGGGAGGKDASAVQTDLGMSAYGPNVNHNMSPGNYYYLADDFEVVGTWNLESIKFYGYQTGSGTTSTFTGIYVQIWDGAPNAGGAVVWGDLTTNRMLSTQFSDVYRVLDTGLTNTDRPIMEIIADVSGCTLNSGTYWVQWGLTGSAASGPWGVAITILGQTTTGNGLQAISTGWQNWQDSGTSTGQGGVFIIEGTAGSQPTKDVGVQAILAPNTGVNLTGAEEVKFIIKNFGTEDQSNIPWTVTMTGQGSASFNGTYAGPLAAGAAIEITAGTANLSGYGIYNFEACVNLAGDENPANNCKTKDVENKEPSLCVDNLYSSGCTYGDGLTSWDFANINVPNIPCSGTPPWYHDYRDMVHQVVAGQTYVLTVTSGYSSTNFDVWIDFNDDLILSNDDELILNDGLCSTGNTPYTFNITIPADAPVGMHVIRYRTNYYSLVTDPCATYTFGNCCDFTIQIVGTTTAGPAPENLQANLINNTTVGLTWEAPQELGEWLQYCGDNNEGLGITDGGTFIVAARWDNLDSYVGEHVKQFALFPRSDLGATFAVRIYKGANAQTLLVDQPLTGLIMDEWNIITLDSPVLIEASTEYWAGYEVTHVEGDYPVGIDAGPAVAGYGDMISLDDGVTWNTLSGFGLDYNFNVKIFVAPGSDGSVAQPIAKVSHYNFNNATLSLGNLKPATNSSFIIPTRGPSSYKVFRDGDMIAQGITVLEYTDSGLAQGTYTYTVKAVYPDGDSDPSNEATIYVPGSAIGPVWSVDPSQLIENHATNNLTTSKYLTITNQGDEILTWDLTIQRASTAGPDVVLDPEWVAEQYAQRAALEGDPLSERNISPSRGGFMDNILEDFDLQFEYPVGVGGGEAGIEADANYIYTSKWNGTDFYRYDYDGTYVGSFAIPGAGQIRDLAYDGTYFYGGKGASTVYIMDFVGQTLIGQFTAPTAVRAIAWDDGEEGLWANNWSTTITLFDLQGAVLGTIPNAGDESFYGFAYDHQGPYLWGYGQSGLNNNQLYKYALPSGSLELTHDVFPMLSLVASGDIAGGLAFQPDIVTGFNTLLGLVQNVCLWGIEMGNTTLFDIDVGVSSIVSPNSGVNLGSSEPVVIKIKNHGANSVSNIPWSVNMTGQGSASFNGTYSGSLAPGADVEISVGTVDLSVYGTYNFEACTNLAGDQNPGNDCKTKPVTNSEPSLCIDNLYSTGCFSFGDGLLSWQLSNINIDIPCLNANDWYHDYRDMVHEVEAGQTYVLTVTAGYTNTYFDVWIDFNNDLVLNNADELILNDGVCATANTPYTFNITIPADAPGGSHVIRYRTNWSQPVTDPCATYSYGNCCDFTIQIGGGTTADWLSAPVTNGSVNPGQSSQIEVVFNSNGLPSPSVKNGNLIFTTNAPGSPHDVPATLNVGSAIGPVWSVNPTELIENHATNNLITSKYLTVTNQGDETLTWDLTIQRASTAGPDVVLDPELVAEQYAQRAALEGDPLSERHISPSRGGFMDNILEDFDLQFEYPVGVGGGEAGIEADANYIYTSKWNGTDFYRYDYDGTYVGSFAIPGAGQIRDLAYDGTYFYGGQGSSTVYIMDFVGQTLIGQFSAPTAVRAIAWDDGEEGLWANNWSTTITLFDLQGAVLGTIPNAGDESFYGFAYDHQGPYLWGYGQSGPNNNQLYKYALPSGSLELTHDVFPMLSLVASGDIAGGLAFQPDIVTGFNTLLGLVQNVCLWGIEMGNTTLFDIDVGVSSIVSPNSGVNLGSSEPVVIKIKNHGVNSVSNIPWSVNMTGQGSASFNGTYSGSLAPGADVEISVGTVNLSAYGTYNFEACTSLSGDQNPGNDCKTKPVTNNEPSLCVDNLYSSGCSFGDGLISWDFVNINVPNIPCSGTPPWYHDYRDMVHEVEAGQTYVLTVTAGYTNTYFDVWIDFNDDLVLNNADELILNDGVCATANTPYTFNITIPADAPGGSHVIRYRTNWASPVTDPCNTYSYGNCCDFKIQIGGGTTADWLSAPVTSGSVDPGQSSQIEVVFNSNGLPVPSVKNGNLIFTTNAPGSPHDVQATLNVGGGPAIVFDPTALTENHAQPNTITTQTLNVTNNTGDPITFNIDIQRASTAGPDVVLDPEWVAEQYAMRQAAEGAILSLGKTVPGGASPNMTDDEIIRWDDGVNEDAIGLVNGGTFYVAAYFPVSTMGQYSGMKLNQVEIFVYDVPTSMVLRINGQGTATSPGPLLHSQPLTNLTGMTWHMIDLTDQVDITGEDLWIGYEVTHNSGSYPAGCDGGPAVAGFGDMISMDGNTYESMATAYGLNYNWNIAGYLIQGTTFAKDVGVQIISTPNTGVNLTGAEVVKFTIKNYGTDAQSNIPWTVTMTGQGSASLNGTYAGPLAAGATVEITAGTANLSAYGIYNFEACTNLAGDEYPNNNCKTKAVENKEPSLCIENLYTTGCYSFGDGLLSWQLANINIDIPCLNANDWYHDFRNMVHEVEAGQTYVLTVTAGYTNTYFDVWIDFNDDLILNNADELILNDGLCATANTPYTFDITIPADMPSGAHVLRYRTNWSQPVTDPCATYSYGNCCDFKIQSESIIPTVWLTADPLTGTILPGETFPVDVTFNSTGLQGPITKTGVLSFLSNAPGSPHDVPATLVVGSTTGPVWSVNPTELIENHATNNLITSKYLTVTNLGSEDLTWDLTIQRASTAGPDVVLDPELVAEQYAQRAALEGDPFSERHISPSRGGFMDNILEEFDLQFEYPVGVGGGEAGIEADANYIYTSKWNGSDFYRYDHDGTYVGSFAIPGAGQIRDLAYDGTYFYGGQGSSTVYIMDFVGQTLIGQFTAPTAVRAIAWDDGEEGLWANNWSTTITLFDLQGAVLGTIPNAGDESFYGFAYDHQGPYLWGYGQSGPNNNQLYKYALPGGSLELTHDVFPMLSLVASGDIAGGLAFQPDIVTGFNTLLGLVQNVCLWGVEMGNTTIFDIDVGVSSIVSPNSGVNLGSSEPVVIKIKNHGTNSVSNIPWSVNMTGQGSASFNGTYSGSLAPGADVEISVGTVNLSAYGTYNFEACTNLAGDQNPGNDCKTKPVTNNEPSLCVDNLYSSGCSFGDGLISWDFANINVPNIPCSGTPPWYHDYRDMVHEVEAGQTYVLTVTAGYTNTYFDVWIDFNDDLVLNNADELILNDGVCATANTPYTFNITIPADAPGGSHVIRYRTNWASPVTDPCNTYSYGNCCDFKIQIGGGTTVDWLSAPVTNGLVPAGQSKDIEVVFNSNGLPSPSVKNGNLIFTTNAPGSPHDVPAVLVVGPGTGPIWSVTPSELIENHPTNNMVTSKNLTVKNLGDEELTWELTIQRASTAGPDIEVDPEWVAEQYAMRQAAEGAILSLGKTVPGGASPNMTDDEIIRWDDGVNDDAIGLVNGGTFYVAAYFPVSTMGQYSGMKLNQVEIFVYDVPTSMVLRINGQGTATSPGPLLHSQPLTNLTGMTWHMIDLTDQVDITGEDLWIGYEVTHNSGSYPAGCDGGPAVAGFGDMISMDGNTYESMATAYGLNYNWNIAGYLIQGTTFAKDVGVQIISSPNTGVNLTGAEVVKFTIKNYGTDAQSNIPWTVTMTGQGSASFNGTYAGPLAAGATVEITAGTANLSAYGIYNFEACTNLAGDEYPNNNCKTKSVENKEPSLCVDNLYSSGCSYGDGLISWDFANINVPNIPCSGTPPWYHDYRDMVHEVEAGQTYVLTVTAGYSNTNFDVWIDFNDDLILNNADELILNDAVCASTNTPYTFNITIPADAPGGAHVLRYRTNWSQPVTDPCATYSFGNCCDFKIQIGGGTPWLSAPVLSGSVAPGQSEDIEVVFNSDGLPVPSVMNGNLIFTTNAPGSPHNVPATLNVGGGSTIVFDPTALVENHATPNTITTQTLNVTNNTGAPITFNIDIQRASTAGPDIEVDPEWVAEQYAQRAALVGDPFSERHISPSRGGFMDNILEEFDLQFEYPVGVGGGEAGIEADANYIYTSKWNGSDFYRYDHDGTYIGSFAIPGAGQIRDLAYDGTYFYGGQGSSTVYIMDFVGQTLIGQFSAPTAVRAIAWDDGEEGLWANNWSTTITLFDLQGAVLGTIPNAGDESFYGFAYDHQGPYLWGYGQSGPNNNQLYKYALPGGSLELTHDVFPMLSLVASGDIAGGLAFQPDIVTGFNTLLGLVQNVCLWGVEMGNTTIFDIDVGVSSIVSPNSGVNLGSSEPVVIKIKNHGTNSVSNIPWSVNMTGQGSASFNGTYSGSLAPGADVEISVGTVNLSAYGTYNFEACTSLSGDQNPSNDCKTKPVTNSEPSLCIDNLYSTGCYSFGDGLLSWQLANINIDIPCLNANDWYHDYRDMVHEVEAGQTYVLTVTAGYTNTYFDVWIDFNNDLVLNNADELILNDAVCAAANTPYTFNITIPDNAPGGSHVIRYRTNWSQPVTDPCNTYSYGNCCDFTIQIGGDNPWLSANPLNGTINPGQSFPVTVTFNSTGLQSPSTKIGALHFSSNAPGSPHTVPATLTVGGGDFVVTPSSLTETHSNPPQMTEQNLTVQNNSQSAVTWSIEINTNDAGPDVVLDPEWVAEQYAQRAALVGDPFSERHISPSRGGFMDNILEEFDLQFEYPVGVGGGEAGIEADANYIYTSKWNGSEFYRYDHDGTYIGSFAIPGAGQIRDLAYDGTYFYGGQGSSTVYIMDFVGQTLIGQFSAPTAVRAIAWDDGEEGLWANNWSTTITLFDLQGAVLGTIPNAGDESFYGFAYDHQGPYLWGYGQSGPNNNQLYKYALPGGSLELTHDVFPMLSLVASGDIAGGLAFQPDIVTGFNTLLGLVQNVCLWGIEMGNTTIFDIDVGVSSIVSPNSGVNLGSSEPVVIKIKNHGTNSVSNIPWSVNMTGQGSASFNGTYSGSLAPGADVEISVGTVNLSVHGTYNFEACTSLSGDQNPSNDCKTKPVTNSEPSLCIDNLYSTGCYSFGDGLLSWQLSNINIDIPCLNANDWYHDYRDMVHEVEAGQTYVLTVTAGYTDTYFDVWIDFNDDLVLNNADELILNDAVCAAANTPYTFNITIPNNAPGGSHVIRYRTNWSQPVTDPCNTYSYGNCCDFTVQIGGVPPQSWLTAEPMSGTLSPGQSGTVKVKFNSAGLDFGTYTGSVIFNNNSSTPVVTVPVTLIVEQGCPLPPPTDLTLQQTGYNPNVVQLTWVAPEEPGGVIRWDNGINNDGIGLVNGGTFAVAAKWNPDQLTQHVGLYLKQVDIFPRSATATYIIKVWTSATVSQPVVSQSATVVSEQWNTITLTNPVQIEAGKPLYIGYETTHGVSEYPAGCDSGPAIANFGDLISTGGGAWVSMSTQFGLDYNWNIAGIIGIGTDGAAPAVPIVITPNPGVSYGSPVAGNLGKPNNAKWVNTSRALVGYDIKRDGQVIGSVGPTVTTYTDSNVQGGTRIYNVGAHYTECTAWSDPATINVFVTELSPDATTLRIYPNPASETVNIESTTIKQIIIVNNLGQVVYDSPFNNDYVQINTSNLRKGMYVIFIRTAGTTFTEKLIIK